MATLKLTKDARADLSAIRRYTIKQFGQRQYDIYRARLETGLQNLRQHPELGFSVDELAPGYRCFAVQFHRMFYRVDGDTIYVVAVLHESQLPQRYLSQRTRA